MKKQLLTVKDIVQITGVTKRTLHYYDKINLLNPSSETDFGYRLYDRNSLEKLQMILILKEMDFSLNEIAVILELSSKEKQRVLENHNQTLLLKKKRLEKIISAIHQYTSGKDIYNLNLFSDSINLSLQEQYDREAKFFYGDTESYKLFENKFKKMTPNNKAELYSTFEQDIEKIFIRIASHINKSPSADEVQQLIIEWKSYLEQTIVCDAEMLVCVANTYKSDNRFKKYINQFSNDNLAEFIYEAIIEHINRKKE